MRDEREAELRDLLYDAFMAYWRAGERERAVLWATYQVAQVQYEAYLQGKKNTPADQAQPAPA